VDTSPTLGARVALAVVTGEADGPATGLAMLDDLDPPQADRFQPAWAARAHLLAKGGDIVGAVGAFDRAISLSTDPARIHLGRQRDAVLSGGRARRGVSASSSTSFTVLAMPNGIEPRP
jgi:predicted RNA polymerase sigma factor